ncbi:hypothetical protein [Streptomyces spiramyceticus]|uniref:hypothetical protein n=1 Tax=Streptomyces spiramyceticus TaxID=299717 RepID=UPI00237A1BB8|nr:hypothetical protein [Streptomyces spiramyceticus]
MTARDAETPDTDDLRGRFQQQARSGLADDRARKARGARIALAAFSTLASVVPLTVVAVGLNAGVGMGIWVAVCALATVAGVGAATLALRGRTRWGFAVFFVAFQLAALGDLLSKRLLQ